MKVGNAFLFGVSFGWSFFCVIDISSQYALLVTILFLSMFALAIVTERLLNNFQENWLIKYGVRLIEEYEKSRKN